MKKFLKKEHIWIAFVLLAILVEILLKPIEDLDEIWNFNIARNIATGLIPYKDISMITTPFIAIISGIILKIFGQEIIVTRILASILATSIIWMTFKILKLLWKDTKISILFSTVFTLLFLELFCLDYNFGLLLIALIILYYELKRKNIENIETNKRQELLIGILAGLAICTKQTIGILLAGITVLEPIIEAIIQKNKKNVKNSIVRAIGVGIPIIILFIYLIVTGAFDEFINYTIKAIPTFTNKIPYGRLLKDDDKKIAILSIILPIVNVILLIKVLVSKKQKTENKNLMLILVYATLMLATVYPIADKIHFLIGTFILILALVYELGDLIKSGFQIISKKVLKKTLNKKKIKIIIETIEMYIILSILTVMAFTMFKYVSYYKDSDNKNKYLEHYKNCIIEDYLQERIREVNAFIEEQIGQGKNVYILDAEAAIYNIPLNIYHKNYDMFNKGNFGEEGENGIIRQIMESQNAIYLVRNPEIASNWQTPTTVIKYVRENLELKGQVSMFDIYE